MNASDIRSEWLLTKLDSLDITPAMRLDLQRAGLPPPVVEKFATTPPPKMQAAWAAFVALVVAGDEVWLWEMPSKELDGRAGFAIIRAGVPVHVYVTSMS